MISFSQAPSIFCRNLYPDFPGNIKEEIRIYFAANTWGFHNHKGKNRQGKKKKTVLTWIFLWLEGIILHSDKGIMPFAVVPETGCTGHFCILSLQHQSKTWLNPEIASPWFHLSSYKAPKWILRQSLCSSITFIYDLVYGIYNFDNISIFSAFEFHCALKGVCFLHYCPVWLSKTLSSVCIKKKKMFFFFFPRVVWRISCLNNDLSKPCQYIRWCFRQRKFVLLVQYREKRYVLVAGKNLCVWVCTQILFCVSAKY